jgi:hypothetical protein
MHAHSDPNHTAPPKKPYRKPEIRHERIFETAAMACLTGKAPGGEGNCRTNRKS